MARTNPEALARRERNRKALRLRASGLSHAQVAAECGFPSEDAARKAVVRPMKASATSPSTPTMARATGSFMTSISPYRDNKGSIEPSGDGHQRDIYPHQPTGQRVKATPYGSPQGKRTSI